MPEPEQTRTLGIDVPARTAVALKVAAISRGRKLKDLHREIIEGWLDEHEPDWRRQAEK